MTIIDTEKLLLLLRQNPTACYTLSKQIGVSRTTLSDLRNGTKDVETLTIRNAKVIQEYLEENQDEH